MKKELDIDWITHLNSKHTIDDKWIFIKDKIKTATENHIPKRRNVKGVPGVINDNILSSIRKKHRMWQRYMETREGSKYQDYCRARNKVKSLIRKSKIEYEKSI